ncbi:MAG: hypothetical protein IT516_12290 [Burkholderiales bacterium]|nr:hypothetical protein [Burkholderiales bacterium]
MPAALRAAAWALVCLLVINAVLWWPIHWLASAIAVVLIFVIPNALRYALDA